MSIDFTKPLQLSDGTPLRLLCTDALAPYPVVCLREDTKLFELFTLDGKRPPGGSIYLMNVPEQVTADVWVNVYIPKRFGFAYASKEEAIDAKQTNGNTKVVTLHIKRTVPVGHVDE